MQRLAFSLGFILALPAAAANQDKQWNRGCAESKAKTYDRANHNADYEAGWNACKSN